MLTVTLGPLTMALNHLLMLTALVIASLVAGGSPDVAARARNRRCSTCS